jgi:hypothetical protein
VDIKNIYVDPKVQRVIRLYADLFAGDFHALPIGKQLDLQAVRLTEAHHGRDEAVCFPIASWHPDLVGRSDERILDHVFEVGDGRVTIAREHGFKDWNQVESLQDGTCDGSFEAAVDTMLSGALFSLRELVLGTPGLLTARSRYGHGATLLHYCGTNGVESYRQVVPLNLAAIVDFLIASGADPAAEANIYGGSTPRALFESSKHSYEANVHREVMAVFREHEAK